MANEVVQLHRTSPERFGAQHPIQTALFRQRTIARTTSIDGIGIHTGNRVQLRLLPAPVNHGVVFRRIDRDNLEIPALASNVTSLELATTLGSGDVSISTVEHLMAAVHVAGIDNLAIEIDGPEVPILDGSALPYWRLLEAVGARTQERNRRIIAVTEPVERRIGDKRIRVSPYPGLRVSYTLDYDTPSIGHQRIDLRIDEDTFERELAPARTFGLSEDIRALHAIGLGLGGHKDNCVVFDPDGPINTELRFDDEPVRHKALDAIGDLALIGAPIWGHVEVERGGHAVHLELVRALLDRPHCWTTVRAESGLRDDSESQRSITVADLRQLAAGR